MQLGRLWVRPFVGRLSKRYQLVLRENGTIRSFEIVIHHQKEWRGIFLKVRYRRIAFADELTEIATIP